MGKYSNKNINLKIKGKIDIPKENKPLKSKFLREIESEIYEGRKDIYGRDKKGKIVFIRGDYKKYVGEVWKIGIVQQYEKFDLGVLIVRVKSKEETNVEINEKLKLLQEKFHGKPSKSK